jgi:hypothetical protein
LDTTLGRTLGYFGYEPYEDDWDDLGLWTNAGYPDDWGGNPEFEDADTIEDSDSEDDGLYLETEASLNHGNSGGPFWAWFLVNNRIDPRIIGVVSAEGAEPEIPRDHDNFLAGGQALHDLIVWGRANLV